MSRCYEITWPPTNHTVPSSSSRKNNDGNLSSSDNIQRSILLIPKIQSMALNLDVIPLKNTHCCHNYSPSKNVAARLLTGTKRRNLLCAVLFVFRALICKWSPDQMITSTPLNLLIRSSLPLHVPNQSAKVIRSLALLLPDCGTVHPSLSGHLLPFLKSHHKTFLFTTAFTVITTSHHTLHNYVYMIWFTFSVTLIHIFILIIFSTSLILFVYLCSLNKLTWLDYTQP